MYIMGLDIGTTGCKAIVFSTDGKIISSAYEEYTLYHRNPGWSELNPGEVWTKIVATVKKSIKKANINPRQIIALATSVLGEAFIPVDKEGNWLYLSMTTFDARAEKQTKWWEENFGAKNIYRITGQPLTSAMPIYTLPKIQWIRENEPNIYKKTFKFLCWEDFINMKLCGNPVTDRSVASRTLMFDIRKKKWASEILNEAGIDENLLPEIQPSGFVVGEIKCDVAKKLGLSKNTLVVTGGHDQACGALGAGIVETGHVMDATGTVECIGVIQKKLKLTERMRVQGYAVHCYVIDGKYFMFGFNPSGGVVLKWYRDNFAQKEKEEAKMKGVDVYDLLICEAKNTPIGAEELFFLPFFEGSGTPTFKRKVRGVVIGLTLAHRKAHVIRAILEGLTFELRTNIEAIERYGIPIKELRAIGGGAKSRFWLQLKADITGKQVVVPLITEAPALGAAILAGLGAKIYKNVEEAIKATYKKKEVFNPNIESKKIYDKNYKVYSKLRKLVIEKIF